MTTPTDNLSAAYLRLHAQLSRMLDSMLSASAAFLSPGNALSVHRAAGPLPAARAYPPPPLNGTLSFQSGLRGENLTRARLMVRVTFQSPGLTSETEVDTTDDLIAWLRALGPAAHPSRELPATPMPEAAVH